MTDPQGNPYPGDPGAASPDPAQPYGGQAYPGAQYPGQQYPGHAYPAQPGQQFPGHQSPGQDQYAAAPQYGYPQQYAPPYQQPYYQQPYGYPPAVAPRNGMGTASLVLGIISVVGFAAVWLPMILGVLAVIFGAVGLGRAGDGQATNRSTAMAGLVLGIVGIAFAVLFVVWFTTIWNFGFNHWY